jgi:hypothetical protein
VTTCVEGDHAEALREKRGEGVEAAAVVEHAVAEDDGRSRGIPPFAQAQGDSKG